MDFKFEPGNYYLAGKETLDGQSVLKIDYLPTQLFRRRPTSEDATRSRRERAEGRRRTREKPKTRQRDKREKQREKEKQFEEDIERKMNKSSQVTLWVDPASHQIVKYTFDNVWLDFLPAGWLVRVDDLRASMQMGQPFPGVWLPRNLSIHAGVDARARVDGAAVQARVLELPQGGRLLEGDGAEGRRAVMLAAARAVASSLQQTETISEVRVHGNATLERRRGDRVRRASPSVSRSRPAGSRRSRNGCATAAASTRSQVRKRYRTLAMDEVSLVLVVHERPGLSATGQPPGVARRSAQPADVLPDPRVTTTATAGPTAREPAVVDVAGKGTRLSVPLSWGGTRRATVEVDRTFKTGPLTRLSGSFGSVAAREPALRDRRSAHRGRRRAPNGGCSTCVTLGARDRPHAT